MYVLERLILFQTVASGVVVDSIAISNSADKGMEILPQVTGGSAYYVSDTDTSDSAVIAMKEIYERAFRNYIGYILFSLE